LLAPSRSTVARRVAELHPATVARRRERRGRRPSPAGGRRNRSENLRPVGTGPDRSHHD
jgi:hypothetical protein